MADDDPYEKGIAIREEMLGLEHGRAKVESQPEMHAPVYCGIPAAVEGFRNASAVLAELGME